jgi:hypothetical protein
VFEKKKKKMTPWLSFMCLRRRRWHDNMPSFSFVVVFQEKRQWQLVAIPFFFGGVKV